MPGLRVVLLKTNSVNIYMNITKDVLLMTCHYDQIAHFTEVLNSPIYTGNLEAFALCILVVQLGVQLVQLHRACSHKGPVLGLMLHCHHFEIIDNLTFKLVVCKWSMNRGNRSGVNICTSYWSGCLAQMCTP